ncbi:MAG TPA: acireductone synthase [Blastocatellia bacterium]|nr:acireductone synthase [Blastocatellia bacterium]
MIKSILLDIEGTTTPIDFVYEMLFPYARSHVWNYLAEHLSSPDVHTDVAGLLEENAADARNRLDPPLLNGPVERISADEIVAYVHWLMDRDRKSTPLKSLQGKIWEEGYRTGQLRGQVFEDVPRAFSRWQNRGKQICIYSSGSVLAQKLLFSNTEAGDLTTFIDGYFDTNIGSKKDATSYRAIADKLGRLPSEILFVSDVAAELDAAATAGFEVVLCSRPGNEPPTAPQNYTAIQTFDELA